MIIVIRSTALALGFAMAGVGMYASYIAYADSGYLMVAAPLVALAAALLPAYAELAWKSRQHVKALALILVWLPCFAMVVLNAIERNHAAKAGGEAERAAMHTAASRAQAELADAKAAAKDATLAANKIRGVEKCGPKCLSSKATETAAIARVAAAEKALTTADGHAVAESATKAPTWLLPVALEVASMFLVACGFGLGRAKPAPIVVEVPAAKPARVKDPKRVAAGKKAAVTKALNKAAKKTAIATGKVVAII